MQTFSPSKAVCIKGLISSKTTDWPMVGTKTVSKWYIFYLSSRVWITWVPSISRSWGYFTTYSSSADRGLTRQKTLMFPFSCRICWSWTCLILSKFWSFSSSFCLCSRADSHWLEACCSRSSAYANFSFDDCSARDRSSTLSYSRSSASWQRLCCSKAAACTCCNCCS